MDDKTYTVLFICTGNSARSILAEAAMNNLAISNGKFVGYSAGSHPKGEPNPFAIELLKRSHISTEGLRSKSVDEFAGERFDYVITLCDKSALECHALPGASEVLAWHFEDPVISAKPDAFRHTAQEIAERIKMFVLVKTKR